MSRDILFIGTALVYVITAAIFAGAFVKAPHPAAVLSIFWVFWVFVILALLLVVIVWIAAHFVRGGRADRLGLKDERDRLIEAQAILYGFGTLCIFCFSAMLMMSLGKTLAGLKLVSGGLVVSFGVIHLIGFMDVVRTFCLSRSIK